MTCVAVDGLDIGASSGQQLRGVHETSDRELFFLVNTSVVFIVVSLFVCFVEKV